MMLAELGRLRHMIRLENPGDPVPDGDGGYTQTWTGLTSAYIPASIEPATASKLERTVAATVASQITHLIHMRYVAGVTTKTRVVFGARTFNINGVENVLERNVELILSCQEVVL